MTDPGRPPPADPARDHVRGTADAPVLLMYGDYECPYTRAAHGVVRALEHEGARFRLAYRQFPLTQIHRHALAAAVAAEAAGELGSFWPMHDLLLAHQDDLEVDGLRRRASEVGLDAERFEAVFGSDVQMARIRDDFRGARAAGVDSTPALFLDGERLGGYEAGWLRERLEDAAARA